MNYVSVRVSTANRAKAAGQRNHDLREGRIPRYIDQNRTNENDVLIRPPSAGELSLRCQALRLQAGRSNKLRRDAVVAVTGIITFSKHAQHKIEALSAEEQNVYYQKCAQALADKLNAELCSLVVHRDETAPHCHFGLLGYDRCGAPLSVKLNKATLSELQDIAGHSYAPLSIARGIKLGDRIRQDDDYSKTIHRSVRQLHSDLPQELEAIKEKLRRADSRLAASIEHDKKRESVSEKLAATIERQQFKVDQLRADESRLSEMAARRYNKTTPSTIEVVTNRRRRLFGLLPDHVETRKGKAYAASTVDRLLKQGASNIEARETEAARRQQKDLIELQVRQRELERKEAQLASREQRQNRERLELEGREALIKAKERALGLDQNSEQQIGNDLSL